MNLSDYIRDIPDFPKEGIVFKDITPLLAHPEAFSAAIDQFIERIGDVDIIAGLDARGFIFAGAIADRLKKPFVPVRKAGKLPYETISESYELEYGKNTFEIHTDAIKKGQKVAVVDDLLATGGSTLAACKLIEELGGEVSSVNFVIEIAFLEGYEKLKKYTKNTIITYK